MAGVTTDVGDKFCLSLDFGSAKLGPDILWYNPPKKYELRCNGATGIKVYTVSTIFLLSFKGTSSRMLIDLKININITVSNKITLHM